MSWSYRLAKQKGDNDSICYSIVEVYMNKDGGIWGWTDTDLFAWLEDPYMDEADIKEDIKGTLEHLMKDVVFGEVLNLDTLETVRPDFQDELDDIKESNSGSG